MREILSSSLFFGAGLTIVCFELATAIKNRLKWPIFNPFLLATLLIIAVLRLCGLGFEEYYGSAKYLSFFVTPATVCLAIPLYRRLEALRRNLGAVVGGIFAGVLSNLAVIYLLCRLMGLEHGVYVSLLPKSITAPIGLALCGEYGGELSVTILAILFTGIFGNVIGESFMKLLRIKSPIARGLAMGASAHAIGTAKAMELGETEGAMSGLAIAVTGVMTVAIAPLFLNLI